MKHPGLHRRLFFSKNLIMMLVFLVVVVLSVWSWFSLHIKVEASEMMVSVRASDDVQIALPYHGSYPEDVRLDSSGTQSITNYLTIDEYNAGNRFKDEIDFNLSDAADKTTNNMNLFRDATSDGSYFLIPTFDGASLRDGKSVNLEAKFTDALPANSLMTDNNPNNDTDYDYISLDFYLRTPNKRIEVSNGSVLMSQSEADGLPLSEDKETSGRNMDSNRICIENNSFSVDSLVGAIRVSLKTARVTGHNFGNEGKYVDSYLNIAGTQTTTTLSEASDLKFLWLPRPDIFLETADSYTNWKLHNGVNPASTNTLSGSSLSHRDAALKSYRHSFYAPDPSNTSGVKKGLVKKTYADADMQRYYNLTNADMNAYRSGAETPSFFHVSKVDTSQLSTAPVYCPTLGENKLLTQDGDENYKVTMLNKFGMQKVISDSTPWESMEPSDKTDYYIYKCTLNIWIEGDDAEARRAMKNGKFQLRLEFVN